MSSRFRIEKQIAEINIRIGRVTSELHQLSLELAGLRSILAHEVLESPPVSAVETVSAPQTSWDWSDNSDKRQEFKLGRSGLVMKRKRSDGTDYTVRVPPSALREILEGVCKRTVFRMEELLADQKDTGVNQTQCYAVRAWLLDEVKALREAGRGSVEVVDEPKVSKLLAEIDNF